MKFSKKIGIVAYGIALPSLSILTSEIEAVHKVSGIAASLGIKSKTVPDKDEDTITLSTKALHQALTRAPQQVTANISALFIGSESHPYAVKPSGTVVANAMGLGPHLSMADLQFACKAGTQAVQIGMGYLEGNLARCAVAIGADTAQGAPGNALEYSAAAGAAAFILGTDTFPILANILFSTSFASDTPDFWRRPGEVYPQHAGRFSGEPAYMAHIISNTQQVLKEANMKISDFKYVVFHTPNKKFPQAVARQLACRSEQLQHSLIVEHIGNTYAGASLLALANVLDHAEADEHILLVSYGSGSGSDAFILKTTAELTKKRRQWNNFVQNQISQLSQISYSQYLQHQHL